MYLSTPNAMDTEQLFQSYFQLQDTKSRRAIILESPTLRTGPFPKPFSAADSPHITTTHARVDPALPLAAIHHLLRVFPVGQDVCNHPDPPEKATGSSAGQRVQRRAPQPALGGGSSTSTHTTFVLPLSSEDISARLLAYQHEEIHPDLPKESLTFPKSRRRSPKHLTPLNAVCLAKNPERGQLLAKHQPPSSDQRLPALMLWVHGSQKRIRGTESLYFVSVGLVSLPRASNNKRHMKRRLSLVHQS